MLTIEDIHTGNQIVRKNISKHGTVHFETWIVVRVGGLNVDIEIKLYRSPTIRSLQLKRETFKGLLEHPTKGESFTLKDKKNEIS